MCEIYCQLATDTVSIQQLQYADIMNKGHLYLRPFISRKHKQKDEY